MLKPAKFETQRHTFIATIVLFTCLLISPCSTRLFAVDVEISMFDAVSTDAVTDVIVTLNPSPVMEEKAVCLNLRLIKGTGGAVFLPGGHTSTNISQTSMLRITGNQLSNIESNMVLEAKAGETIIASNIFTIVDTDMTVESKAIKTTTPEKKGRVKTQGKMITKSEATEIARAAIKGKMKIQEGAPITVELKGKDYIVTFGWIPPKVEKGEYIFGPDYTAKVTLDAYTGSVKKILAAP